MAQEGFKRKLTAILSADVEGYSRLMGEDADTTIRTLTTKPIIIDCANNVGRYEDPNNRTTDLD
jgi:hypothetical protein